MVASYNDPKVRLNHTVVCRVHQDSIFWFIPRIYAGVFNSDHENLYNYIVFYHKTLGGQTICASFVHKLGRHVRPWNSVPGFDTRCIYFCFINAFVGSLSTELVRCSTNTPNAHFPVASSPYVVVVQWTLAPVSVALLLYGQHRK